MLFAKAIAVLCFVALFSRTLCSSDDRFIKKYAMMKIYESCFGPDVVKQIRQEMKEACAKCAAAASSDVPLNPNPTPPLFGKLPPGFAMDPNSQTITRPNDAHFESPENEMPHNYQQENPMTVGKMPNQVMAFRPQPPPYQPPQPLGIPHQPLGIPPYPPGQLRPFGAAAPFYQFPSFNWGNPTAYYPGLNPYSTPYQQQPYYPQQYYGPSQRMSREMDFRDRFDMLTQHGVSPKARNITCVMQELGYLDHNLEPNYEKITARIANLPVSPELRGDIQDGLQFCEKFAQCVPDVKKDVAPLSKELVKPMFFFRCYKHKKLEACIMKDIRERFSSEDELETETDFRSLGRSGKSLKDSFPITDPQMDALDEMSVYLYDFLSGSNTFDFDLYM